MLSSSAVGISYTAYYKLAGLVYIMLGGSYSVNRYLTLRNALVKYNDCRRELR